jgi:peptidoglycan hydrolase-like protein with peptidoglycan-binding domain
MSRSAIIAKAASQNGTKEHPAGSDMQPYGAWYGMNGVRWCAIFVSWVYHQAGHPLGKIESTKGFHYCQGGYQYFKSHGRLTKDPQQGDIVFYDWSGDGHCDHAGIFDAWSDATKKYFFAWEGNTAVGNNSDGGRVMKRKRAVSLVKAFASPAVLEAVLPVLVFGLREGDTGAAVTAFQKLLWQLKYDIVVDGEFGPRTGAAVKKFQADHFLDPTGIVTPQLEAAMIEVASAATVKPNRSATASYLRRGNAGPAVLQLQRALKQQLSLPALKTDGVFGISTLRALKKFQQSKGLTADGIAGPKTFFALGIS